MERIKCCLCGKEINEKESHNAEPLMSGRCCVDCNLIKVIPERIKLYKDNNEISDDVLIDESLDSKELKEEYTSDDLFQELTDYIKDKLAEAIDNIAIQAVSDFPQYDADWCSDNYSPVESALYNAAGVIAENLLVNAPEVIEENLKESVKLTEKKWDNTLSIGIELRNAIDNDDYVAVIDCLKEAYKEIHELKPDDFTEDELENELENIDMSVDFDDEEEIEDSINYLLSDFYDLCDNLNIWIEL